MYISWHNSISVAMIRQNENSIGQNEKRGGGGNWAVGRENRTCITKTEGTGRLSKNGKY